MNLCEFVASISDKERYIRDVIIPSMDIRQERTSPLDTEEILSRLHSLAPQKPGEEHEWAQALRESKEGISPQLAAEVADLVYYYLQPNASDKSNLQLVNELIFGGDDLPFIFCIIKYSTRLAQGDKSNYKELEYRALTEFLSKQ